MVAPIFYGVIIFLSIDVVNPIFPITMVIFVKILTRDSCDVLESIIPGLN